MEDPIILKYGNVVLRESDIKLLQKGCWLNDTIIEFYYEYLERNVYADNGLVAFIRPAITYLISQHTGSMGDISSALPPNLKLKKLLFFPINNAAYSKGGGSHWSLLVYYRPDNTYYYYDSLNNMNLEVAKVASQSILPFIKNDSDNDPYFSVMETPHQENGYDCGLFVIAITDLLAERLCINVGLYNDLSGKPGDASSWRIMRTLRPDRVKGRRLEIKTLIENLIVNRS